MKIGKDDLPPAFIHNVQGAFGDAGRKFLNDLPRLIDCAAGLWSLTDLRPVPNLSYNFVAFARRGGREVVLKAGVPDRELISEMTALRLFDGRGAVRLLEADEGRAMFLLERLEPGEMLASLPDDEEATRIAAGVMRDLWRPAPQDAALIRLPDWFKGFEKLRRRYEGGTGPFDEGLVVRAERSVQGFFSEAYVPMLVHGDLHHFNILSSARGWLAIDPKGVIGPAAYEVGPLLINPWGVLGERPGMRRLIERRIAILSEQLDFERSRLLEWGLAHAVLSAWWSLSDGDKAGWGYSMGCARLLAGIRL